MSAQRPVLIMAGGTGGHIFPGLAVAAELRERGVPVVWLGAEGGLETTLVPAHRIDMDTVRIGGLRGKGWRTRLTAPFVLARAVLGALRILRRYRPRSVLSMGGYVAGPGGLAAWLLRTPLLVHEQNRVPGVTNRVLAKLARTVLVGFADAFPPSTQAEWVGNPVRADIAALPSPSERFAKRSGKPRLLVLGGSQGARTLNRRVPAALGRMPSEARPEVLHQCGKRDLDVARQAYAEAGVEARVEAFIEDMGSTYAWADLAVCRAGALTLAELAAAGLGSILVPFPYAVDDHQTKNAEALCEAGAATLIQERDLREDELEARLHRLLGDRAQLLKMAEAARALARADTAARIADRCLEVAA
ncbi:undecaprenyldiphospho-muramoylpentapeptide beta-N-acetylglucosaminyltransferase [Oleiagrimonas soli]|uniref:UDP-N-acetylglucosamine--N-acetylmuramyl-(pentapeptide) pyrophosphoryl-undecaprenol N-acetylglucosamine transferase n=1 Tax=Oleiagrimonas soli TaxID=1543381 RepID=A0A099CSY8_9GAMM|nr:undecaprenyldiphospho-muramoylpentapeptide beta-N-acetylglucosaminyltransferase [Oleiagrimonas soli]KGI77058.1 UDP-diphospho-muramoylpentapeptide beta-N- acetylglucosaminyltransferase [Oleiagrimonas soli]MBB6185413.1 UDP-N-acetylglucosamine--N-acetylmuramyl-(pentapeptide) pyrophosphoryl-undecaprenol N-acetylglucosamine transferase [Oleiagrimonas soli]